MTNIEEYSPEYKERIIGLILNIQREEFGIPITRNDQPDLEDIGSFYGKGDGNFWIAREDDEVLGTIGLLDIGGGRGVLRKMFVKKESRGGERGIARSLLRTLFAWSAGHGMEEIFLGTIDKFVAAHRFYEKNGFRRITREELPDGFPFMKVDSVFYAHGIATAGANAKTASKDAAARS